MKTVERKTVERKTVEKKTVEMKTVEMESKPKPSQQIWIRLWTWHRH